jgi:antitoxin HicB
MDKHPVEYYLHLPYTIEVIRDNELDNPGWVARVAELSGCITQADDFEELGQMIDEAMRSWIEAAMENNFPIPEPRPEEDFSGKFVIRLPKSLHRRLSGRADQDGVSLNTFCTAALAEAVGRGLNPKRRAEQPASKMEIEKAFERLGQ